MNDLIKQFAIDCAGQKEWDFPKDPKSYTFTPDEVAKFAELIVKECVYVIQKEVSLKYKDGGETEEFMGGHYASSLLARVKIKRHFGVEE